MISNKIKRVAASLLAVMMLSTAVFASEAYGPEVYRSNIALGHEATLSKGLFWSETSSKTRAETYIAYTPNTTIIPVVDYGGTIVSTTSMADVNARLQAKGMTLAGGINGDYFVMATGESLGLLVTDGVMRSTSTYLPALGFRADGSAVIGYPNTKVTVTTSNLNAASFTINDINKSRTRTNCVLLTPDYASTTLTTEPGVDVIIENLSGEFTIGGTVTGTVRQVVNSSGAIDIPAGCCVLTINAKSSDTWRMGMMSSLMPGDSISFSVTADDPAWSQVVTALGGMYVLVENGRAVKGLETTTPPRTVVGVKADGTVLFYNSPSTTEGAATTLDQVAVRLTELGCVSAICLDGGGSSTVAATYPGSVNYSIINSPSGGSLRSCSNYLVLANTAPSDGIARSLWVYPYDVAVLSGATVNFTAKAADSASRAATLPAGVTYSVSGSGTISESGLYTAYTAGTDTVMASGSGLATGTATVKVTSTPDSIVIKNQETDAKLTSLNIQPGETIDLTAKAYSNHVDLVSQDTCFTWGADAAIGTITTDGVFTASGGGEGYITVSAGGTVSQLKVRVRSTPTTLADFESSVLGGTASGITATRETASDLVKFGKGSMKLAYTLTDGFATIQGAAVNKPEGAGNLILSVYGDNSGNTLYAVINSTAVEVCTLNFKGWKTVSVPIDSAKGVFDGFVISGKTDSGVIYIDQVVCSNTAAVDTTPPTITGSLSGRTLTVSVTDNTTDDCVISLTYDGKTQTITPEDGTFTYTAPSGKGVHRITVTAVDAYGNRGSYSAAVGDATEDESPFADMGKHWAKDSVNYLYKFNIVSGIPSGDKINYNPDSNMTRAQFAVIVANWMGVDTGSYSSVQLPFDDAASIPSWALNSVKAMYSLGIIKGNQSGNKLLFNQGSSITRAEACTIIGRTQPKGYSSGTLSFSDSGKVPSWASEYMSALAARGVISGYNGKVEPGANITRAQAAKILCSLI